VTRVTLLTDFGTEDGYAAAMAGVVASASPDAVIDHASHAVAQGDVLGAALALSRYAGLYPEGTVHLVVVDPGVGTARRAIAARVDGRFYVAPDNGVLTRVLSEGTDRALVSIAVPDDLGVSPTFHGRDVFAPAAARLARGDALESLGSPLRDPVMLPLPEPERRGDCLKGEVIQVDRFGNLISNIPGRWLEKHMVQVAGMDAGPVRRTYADVAPGELVAVVGSLGLLEVSVRDGNAADRLGADRGAPVSADVPAGPDDGPR
jgi:S-adenosylmethionine hydrolase